MALDLAEMLKAESNRVEWKRAGADEREIVQALTAFANDYAGVGGGSVVCGVEDTNDTHGFKQAQPVGLDSATLKRLRGRVTDLCHRNVTPPLQPGIEEVALADDPARRLLVFSIDASEHVHAYHHDKEGTQYWLRIDDRTRQDKGALVGELLLRKHLRKHPHGGYLDQRCPGATREDIDQAALERYCLRLGLPHPAVAYVEPNVRLQGHVPPLVTSDGTPSRLAILVFGREPERLMRSAHVIVAVYGGVRPSDAHSQRFDIRGPLPELFDSTLVKLRVHVGLDIDKQGGPDRETVSRPLYAERALREALANALVHRDYSAEQPVRVSVFADRIEVGSPGGPHGALDRERVQNERYTPPDWRNPSLEPYAVGLGIAENLGQGIGTIFAETERIARRAPEFKWTYEHFLVVIPAARPALAPVVSNGTSGRDAVLVVTVGMESIRPVVEATLPDVGLSGAEVMLDLREPGWVEPDTAHWSALARRIRNEIRPVAEDPRYGRFHLFYRGPLVLGPLLGALLAPTGKPVVLYYNIGGRYEPAFTLDRRFLASME
jgi:ATP-dependent DNA helicase RecG